MNELETRTVYYQSPGEINTERTFHLTRARAKELGLDTILVATTTGKTGVIASRLLKGFNVIVVTHSTGFKEPNTQELTSEHREVIESNGAYILTCMHAFGGISRAVRKMLGTYELDEIIAYTLRLFGQGMKVCVEMAVMAADAGLVDTDTPVMCVAGTGKGADTSVVILPSNVQNFFDLKVLEVICWPAQEHPAFTHDDK